MSVENVTASRGYQLPYPDNDLSVDVGRIIAAINGLDVDVATLIAGLSGKAAASHTHAINDVSGLQAALDGKVGTGTELPISQVTNLQAALDARAPINNATFTGTTTGVSPSVGANNTQFATTAWVRTQGFLTGIADGAIVTAKIGDGQVTGAKLADGAISTSAKMLDAIVSPAKATAALRAISVGAIFDGGGADILPGMSAYVEIPCACTITGWTLMANATGSIVVDVKRATYSGFPTTSSIAGTEKPTLASARKAQDANLTTWTASLAAGDILELIVDSASGVGKATVQLTGQRT